MSSSVTDSETFNPIRGAERFEVIQGGKSPSKNADHLRDQLEQIIDDVRYSEGMLAAYDGERKGVRDQLRWNSQNSRDEIFQLLNQLEAPVLLTQNCPHHETRLEWMREIDEWMKEDVRMGMTA